MKVTQSNRKKELYKNNPEKHPNSLCSKNKKNMSYPEKLAYEFFTVNNINFLYNKSLKCGDIHYWPDFIINNNLIIEIDGEKWHSSDEQKARDRIRDSKIKYHHPDLNIIRIPAKNILENLKNIFIWCSIENINIKKVKEKIIDSKKIEIVNNCVNCNIKIHKNSIRCKKCNNVHKNKNNKHKNSKINVCKEELILLIKTNPIEKVGKMFNVMLLENYVINLI